MLSTLVIINHHRFSLLSFSSAVPEVVVILKYQLYPCRFQDLPAILMLQGTLCFGVPTYERLSSFLPVCVRGIICLSSDHRWRKTVLTYCHDNRLVMIDLRMAMGISAGDVS